MAVDSTPCRQCRGSSGQEGLVAKGGSNGDSNEDEADPNKEKFKFARRMEQVRGHFESKEEIVGFGLETTKIENG